MSKYKEWQTRHGEVISSYQIYLNSKTYDFILKGGTALLTCYGLDRFLEDIDLDGKNKSIEKFVANFCEKENPIPYLQTYS
ncbi:nucleotidyl transferase AbiEii/AbiGii toxin family protein [Thermoanaerobacterium sp. RBIITD]|uniref:nucleotidyl transferase AbiEii/AbiGii toxin family protein n=1 Tax=Thermoanaerobacterium sp. RBIITD TaxID=1550240 RepID=UPI0033139125